MKLKGIEAKDPKARRGLMELWELVSIGLLAFCGKIDIIEKRLDAMEGKLSEHDDALNKMEADLTTDEADVAGIKAREDASDVQVAALQQEVSDLKAAQGNIAPDDTAALQTAAARLEALDAQLKALGVQPATEVSNPPVTPEQPLGDPNAPGVGVVPQG